MKKQSSPAQLRKLLLRVLSDYEIAFGNAVAMSLVLKKHGLLKKDIVSADIRRVVHARFEHLIKAIETQDEEALREALLNMPTPKTVN